MLYALAPDRSDQPFGKPMTDCQSWLPVIGGRFIMSNLNCAARGAVPILFAATLAGESGASGH
jgi:hypothetical protein